MTESNDLVRIITFQSKEVLSNLKQGDTYFADDSKKREQRDYKADRLQLGGFQPVWGFKLPYQYTTASIYRGSIFLEFTSEMSLGETTLADYICLELFVPSNLIKLGLTHNSCYFAVVFPYIKKKFLHRAYNITYTCGKTPSGEIVDLPRVKILETFNNSEVATFEDNFSTLTREEYIMHKDNLTTDFPFKSMSIGLRYNYEDANILL